MKFWFDVLTPKQINFFKPVVDELRNRKHDVLCTTRNYREVNELAKIKNFELLAVGEHGGESLYGKLYASADRVEKLIDVVDKFKPDSLISLASPEASRVAFGLGVRHVGFCLPPFQEIITADGLKPICEVKEGDYVLTHKGRFRRVLRVMQRHYEGDMIAVKTKCAGEEFMTVTTPEHPYITRHLQCSYGRSLTYFTSVQAGQMRVFQANRTNDYVVFPRIVETRDLEYIEQKIKVHYQNLRVVYKVDRELLTIIGYYLAEGYLAKEKSCTDVNTVCFSFGKNLREYTYASEVILAADAIGLKSHLYQTSYGWRVRIRSAKLARFLRDQFGVKATGKKIPLWVKRLPPNKLKILFECYMNGDGYRYRKRKNGSPLSKAITVSRQLALDMRDVALRLGYVCSIGIHNVKPVILGRNVSINKRYVLHFTASSDSQIRNDGQYIYLAVKEIRKVPYRGHVLNLEVEEDHTFCTPFHALHNCDAPHAEAVCRLSIPLMTLLMCPSVIPSKEFTKYGINQRQMIRYKALDPAMWLRDNAEPIYKHEDLGLDKAKKTITFRFEESQAAYLSGIDKTLSFKMLRKIIDSFSDCNIVILSRYSDQIETLKKEFSGKAIVIERVIDGTSLLLLSDVFIGSGGTMNWECALLGIPNISYTPMKYHINEYLIKKKLVVRCRNVSSLSKYVKKMLDTNYRKSLKKKSEKELSKMEDLKKLTIEVLERK